MKTSPDRRGFTLIEVLVALVVLSLALIALIVSFGASVDTAQALRERTIAMWVAENRYAMRYVIRDWSEPVTIEGSEEMAGRQWYWKEIITGGGDNDLRQIDIEVRVAPEREAAARLTGYLSRPP